MRFLLGLTIFITTAASLLAQQDEFNPQQKSFPVGGFVFERPELWEWVAVTTPMRIAQLKFVDTETKNIAETVFFHFGKGQGGTVENNVDRWLGQFQESREKLGAKIEKIDPGGTPITLVSASGTFEAGMPGTPTTPMPDYSMQGAILEGKQGLVFVKMTGPKQVVTRAAPAFIEMVKKAGTNQEAPAIDEQKIN